MSSIIYTDTQKELPEKEGVETDLWIPIREGGELPNHGDTVLITIKIDDSYGAGVTFDYIVCEGEYDAYVNAYLPLPGLIPGGFNTFNDWDEGQPIDILAWKPMPAPYKEETE